MMIKIKRALVSVSDKSGLLKLTEALREWDIELISTGGTYQQLKEAGYPVTYISEVTGFPEILDGRVKTLHPKVHGGLLALREERHLQQLRAEGIQPIDLAVVNLYPFAQTVSRPDVTWEEAVEMIDIGGPSMIRSAAKNHRYVGVLVDPEEYDDFIRILAEHNGAIPRAYARRLAGKAFKHTAAYDLMIQDFFESQKEDKEEEFFPERLLLSLERTRLLRYGENPHQQAAFYWDLSFRASRREGISLPNAEQLHGKELSFNNINDGNAALELVMEFEEPAVVALKHTNPCGVGLGGDLFEAYQKAYESDPVSIFGGIIAVNRELDAKTAEALSQIFLEIIIAPGFSREALEILQRKKNLRLLKLPLKPRAPGERLYDFKRVRGGFLVQESDSLSLRPEEIKVVTSLKPTEEDMEELFFAWKIVKRVKSNAIVLTKDRGTVGVGPGQMNRVGAARIAIEVAGQKAQGAYLASDAFFPMPDTVEAAAAAGVKAIIQPGGSIRDQDSISAADQAGMIMVFTGIRHFRH